MDVPQDWVRTALSTTGHFEDSQHPFSAVSGNFDGMGISVGVLQWNIGSGSLQPLVLATDAATIQTICPTCGSDLLRACTAHVSDGLAIVSAWQIGSQLKPAILAELKALAQSNSFTAQQVKAATAVAQKAYNTASAWYQIWSLQLTQQAYCWFFDVYTQNGGVSDVTTGQIDSFIGTDAQHAVNTICDWLSTRQSFEHGARDSIKNSTQWRTVSGPSSRLFVGSYLRSQKSKLEWRADVLNRKATIAVGSGWVHGEKVSLLL